ncbi:hypothetical protein RJ640_015046 [Escallonia rubra]|uniref:Peptidase S54 rhomboid domain-containing protein n=1 Tax=Escallonia rubra TaxID=112253 RepID=A0AA88SFU8_9ASTE|nr:hypothetical protein RJ640_015046 [Escallonia rubra]
MQRLLALKLLSKNPRNLPNTTSSFQSIHSTSLLSRPKTNPAHLHTPPIHQSPHYFSPYTTCSNSRQSPNTIFKKISGFLSNPILAKGLLKYSFLKGPSKCLVDSRVRLLRAQFPRNFQYKPPFNFHSRQAWLRRLTADGVLLGLIMANVAVFILWQTADSRFMMKNFMISLDNVRSGRLHTIITSAFSHNETGHLLSNMIGLYFFGKHLGQAFGPAFLLKLYLSGAVAGSAFYLVHKAYVASSSKGKGLWSIDPSRTPGLGASGAVNAIMLLDIFLFPKNTIYLEFIVPVPAFLVGLFIIGHDMWRVSQGDTKVSGAAHLGGAVVAAVAWAGIRRGRF